MAVFPSKVIKTCSDLWWFLTIQEIFELIVATFRGLNDISSPYFATRLHILSTVASVRSCIVMLNIECNDLIHEMFQTFFATVR